MNFPAPVSAFHQFEKEPVLVARIIELGRESRLEETLIHFSFFSGLATVSSDVNSKNIITWPCSNINTQI